MSKFCGNCGSQLDDSVKVCGYCGTPCNSGVSVEKVTKAPSGKIKKIIISAVLIIAIVVGASSLFSLKNEPCDWCGHSPSVAYKTSDGGKSYVCRDCSKECAWCDNRATKHYENYFEMIVFVCRDCYEDIA